VRDVIYDAFSWSGWTNGTPQDNRAIDNVPFNGFPGRRKGRVGVMPELDILEILTRLRDLGSSLSYIIVECNNEDEKLQLLMAHDEFEQFLNRIISRQQEILNVPANATTRELLRRLTEVQELIEGHPSNLIDVGAVLRALASVRAILQQADSMMLMGFGQPQAPAGYEHHVPAKPPTKCLKEEPIEGKVVEVEVKKMHRGSVDVETKVDTVSPGGFVIGARLKEILDADSKVTTSGLPKKRVVNTGFSPQIHPDHKIDRKMPLKSGESYYFWLDIGPLNEKSIEETPTEPPSVPAKARLTVAVFGFHDGLLIFPGADVGELEIQEDGTARVVAQPQADYPPRSRYRARRLFFPVSCPTSDGTFRLRCNIYWGQILLQSRVIYAQVIAVPLRLSKGQWALRSVLDYTLSQKLDPALLTQLTEHRLSILLNSNDDATNSIHVYGSKGEVRFKRDDIRFNENDLHDLIESARGSLRRASWGNEEEWKDKTQTPFVYQDGKLDLPRLSKDLISMAIWGHSTYVQINLDTEFEEVLFEPSLIQIAMLDSPRHVLPAAMIYDYPLEDSTHGFTLCWKFLEALKDEVPLEDHECFKGNCPTRQEKKTVCPSGFWGFRHYLGMPLSVKKEKDEGKKSEEDLNNVYVLDIAASIRFTDPLRMVLALAKDFNLVQLHEEVLRGLKPNHLDCQLAETHDQVFNLLELSPSPHLIYFYCHGALVRNQLAYLQMGKDDQIFPANFEKIKWNEPRPLIFMNGCHTIDPLGALNFIRPLVQGSNCAGVIGTEITIYEEMATVFAEEFFRRFMGGEAVGKAIRNARLKLLKVGNPLGLVYIPYVIAGLRLMEQFVGENA
jgi:hypothetical protein